MTYFFGCKNWFVADVFHGRIPLIIVVRCPIQDDSGREKKAWIAELEALRLDCNR